jgi:two-component system sensor histidine kinase/response regulator
MDPSTLKEIKVLIVEDDEDDWLIVKKIFSQIKKSPFIIEWAPTYQAAIDRIMQDEHDLYLLDYRLGEHSGTDILRLAHPEARRQPFILMTGVADNDLEWKSLKLAAADYLVKGSFDAILLSRTLFYALQRKFVEQQRIDQLIELNQAKEEFISIASHQLRTPATGVKQYLGMVIEGFAGDVPDAQRELLVKAYENNERQLRIISDLLKVAQVDSGKMRLRLQPIDINTIVEDVVCDQREAGQQRSQTIDLELAEHPAIADADEDTLRMVLENIIDNARKYSPEGKPVKVTVSDQGDEVIVRVTDQGVGIHDDDVPRLFQKFVRIDNPLSKKVGGTGLGLYWAKHIIDMHGGRISFKPSKPIGSTFIISLPKHQIETVN